MKKMYFFIILLLAFMNVNSQYVQKVTSINYYGYNGLNPSNLTVFGGKLFFFGTDDPKYVDKLMYTPDGSAEGITIVKQIDTVKQYSTLRHLTVLNALLIFDNYDHLWTSDGTAAGTTSIASLTVSQTNFVVLNSKVYFAGDNTNSNPIKDQLWQTDGTPGGTTLVKTINSSGGAAISSLFSYGGKVYFSANDGVNQNQLWVSDGTAAGTSMLKKLNAAGAGYPSNFTAFNGKVYFKAQDGVNGVQLWSTDGTTAGTQEITAINGQGNIGLQPSVLTVFGAKLFFMGIDRDNFYQLWSTDGTTAGTNTVKTDYTPAGGGAGFSPTSMAVHKNTLYLSGYDSLSKTVQLWKTDGTTAGTVKITSFSKGLFPAKLYSFQSRLIFTGYDTISGQEQLFASDGTATGTVCPTPPDTWGQYPFYPWEAWVPFNNALYYKGAYSYFADYQLCRYSENASGIDRHSPEKFSVYPNPASTHLTIAADRTIASIKIVNQVGQMLFQSAIINQKSIILDCSTFANGMYLAEVTIDQKTVTQKFIVRH